MGAYKLFMKSIIMHYNFLKNYNSLIRMMHNNTKLIKMKYQNNNKIINQIKIRKP